MNLKKRKKKNKNKFNIKEYQYLMKSVVFDKFSEMLDDILDKFEDNGSISVFADFNLVEKLLSNLDDYKNEFVNIDAETEEYLISKTSDSLYVEKARCDKGEHIGELKEHETDIMIIFEDACKDYDEIIEKYGNAGDIETVIYTYNEYDLSDDEEICECEPDCDCCQDCDECDDIELSDSEQEELDIISDYVDRIIKSEGCPDCVFEVLSD
jgi:hypothetical protein